MKSLLAFGAFLAFFASGCTSQKVFVARDLSECGNFRDYDFATCLLEVGHEREAVMIIKHLAALGDRKAMAFMRDTKIYNDVRIIAKTQEP